MQGIFLLCHKSISCMTCLQVQKLKKRPQLIVWLRKLSIKLILQKMLFPSNYVMMYDFEAAYFIVQFAQNIKYQDNSLTQERNIQRIIKAKLNKYISNIFCKKSNNVTIPCFI